MRELGRLERGGVVAVAVVLAAIGLAGCGGDDDVDCARGTEACTCTSVGTCNAGLTCAAGKCVAASGGTDGGGAGGTDGGGGGGEGVDADAGGGDMGPVSTDPAVICAGIQQYCERFNTCAPYYISLEFGTVARCTERLTLSCLDAVMAPGSGLDGSTMAACTAALAGASCDDLFNRNIAACNFKGTRENGTACGTDEQCASGRCVRTATGCGTCGATVADGAVCAFDEDCAPGRLCNEDDRCVVPADPQAICSSARPCRLGYACAAGACQPAVTMAGAACGNGCSQAHGLFCSGTTCAAIPLNAAGAACQDSDTAPAFCAAGTCILPQVGDMGTCRALAADGEACGDASEYELDCQAPALCVSGKCTRVSASTCN
jgi:hypothetical protein